MKRGNWDSDLVKKIDSFFGVFHHSRLIKECLDISFIKTEVKNNLGVAYKIPRQAEVHKDSIHVSLKSYETLGPDDYYGNQCQTAKTINYDKFPILTRWLNDLAHERRGELGQIIISILKPFGRVYFHCDHGVYYAMRDRYHLVLKSSGTKVYQANQVYEYKEGQLWFFNNKVLHGVANNSVEERIHIIFDLLPNSYGARLINLFFWIYWGLRPGRLKKYYLGNINEAKVFAS